MHFGLHISDSCKVHGQALWPCACAPAGLASPTTMPDAAPFPRQPVEWAAPRPELPRKQACAFLPVPSPSHLTALVSLESTMAGLST